MSKEKFTQGEWVAAEYQVRCDGGILADCGFSSEHNDVEELANAHLIAAAPDMYNKLKELSKLIAMLDPYTHDLIELDCVTSEIEKLLAKARGE